MAEEKPKETQLEAVLPPAPAPAPPPAPVPAPAPKDVDVEKNTDDFKSLALVESGKDASKKKTSKGSLDRDIALAELDKDKRFSLIKAWEENEKSKANNKAQKKKSDVASWENNKKASLEAKLKKMEENLEEKKAKYTEKMKNKVAEVHKQAEEKKAIVEAIRGEELLKAEEMAAKYRATGSTPTKFLGCF